MVDGTALGRKGTTACATVDGLKVIFAFRGIISSSFLGLPFEHVLLVLEEFKRTGSPEMGFAFAHYVVI